MEPHKDRPRGPVLQYSNPHAQKTVRGPRGPGGGNGGNDDLEARVAKVEQSVAGLEATATHLATKTWVTVAVGTVIALTVGSILSVMLYLHGDLKEATAELKGSMRSGFSRVTTSVERVVDKVSYVREDVAYLKAKHDSESGE